MSMARAIELQRHADEAAGAGTTVLEIGDLTVRYGSAKRSSGPPAVDRVSLTVDQREIVGVVGESGSGKTSIAMVAAGLWSATEGSVKILGKEVSTRMPRHERAAVQMVFQDPHGSFDPRQSVQSGFRELRALHRERSGWISDEDLLRRVELQPNLLNRLPHQLSGGQAQRVSIARALLLRPRLLIADEPTSALDVSVQAQILALLQSLCQDEGLSVLFISHDLAVVRSICHRVYVMRAGRVVESGVTSRVMEHPQDGYTVKLLAAIPGHFGRNPRVAAPDQFTVADAGGDTQARDL